MTRVHGDYKAWLAREGNRERVRALSNERRVKNHARIREYEKAWLNRRPLYSAVKRAKHRAKVIGVPFDLDDRKLYAPEFCPVLGLRLRYGVGNLKVGPDSPSIDRLRPELGYIPSNVRVISHKANTIKSDATAEEIAAVLKYLLDADWSA